MLKKNVNYHYLATYLLVTTNQANKLPAHFNQIYCYRNRPPGLDVVNIYQYNTAKQSQPSDCCLETRTPMAQQHFT